MILLGCVLEQKTAQQSQAAMSFNLNIQYKILVWKISINFSWTSHHFDVQFVRSYLPQKKLVVVHSQAIRASLLPIYEHDILGESKFCLCQLEGLQEKQKKGYKRSKMTPLVVQTVLVSSSNSTLAA